MDAGYQAFFPGSRRPGKEKRRRSSLVSRYTVNVNFHEYSNWNAEVLVMVV